MSRQEDMSERALCMLCYLILYEIYDLRSVVGVEEELKQRQEGWLLVAGYRDRFDRGLASSACSDVAWDESADTFF